MLSYTMSKTPDQMIPRPISQDSPDSASTCEPPLREISKSSYSSWHQSAPCRAHRTIATYSIVTDPLSVDNAGKYPLSLIALTTIPVPSVVHIYLHGPEARVSVPKGQLAYTVPEGMSVRREDSQLLV